MTTLLLTHPVFLEHDTGPGHPERPDRMRAIDKALAHELFATLKREEAPLGDDVEDWSMLASAPDTAIHLYGKTAARPGRKMGHVNQMSPPKA